MHEEKIIAAASLEYLLQKAEEDILAVNGDNQYHVSLECEGRRILLDITNSSFIISAYLFSRNEFRFSIHKQGALDELGKLLGMQDVLLGYKRFDELFVVKSNDEAKVASLFIDKAVTNTFTNHPNLTFGIVEYILENDNGKVPFLELKISNTINNISDIRDLLTAFYKVLEIAEG